MMKFVKLIFYLRVDNNNLTYANMLKQPSASVNPTNHSRNCFESLGILEDLDKSMGLLFGNLQLIYFSRHGRY